MIRSVCAVIECFDVFSVRAYVLYRHSPRDRAGAAAANLCGWIVNGASVDLLGSRVSCLVDVVIQLVHDTSAELYEHDACRRILLLRAWGARPAIRQHLESLSNKPWKTARPTITCRRCRTIRIGHTVGLRSIRRVMITSRPMRRRTRAVKPRSSRFARRKSFRAACMMKPYSTPDGHAVSHARQTIHASMWRVYDSFGSRRPSATARMR